MTARTAYAGPDRRSESENNSLTYKWLVGVLIAVMTAMGVVYVSTSNAGNAKVLDNQQQFEKRMSTVETKIEYLSQGMETLLKRVEH